MPLPPDLGERVEDDVDDLRRQPQGRLVEQQHVRARDERPPDRELLLLAAGEGARRGGGRNSATTGNSS